MKKAFLFFLIAALLAVSAVTVLAQDVYVDGGNSFSDATSVQIGVNYIGKMNEGWDEDYFKFTTISNRAHYEVYFKNLNIDSRMEFSVYDMYQSEVRNEQSIFNSNSISTTFLSESSKVFYIKVFHDTHWWDANNNTGNYMITVTYRLDSAPDSFGTNAAVLQTSDRNAENNKVYKLSMDGKDDVDWYQFSAIANAYYLVSFKNLNIDGRMGVYVYDKYQSLVKDNDCVYNTNTCLLSFRSDQTGTYYIRVEHVYSDALGDYQIYVNYGKDSAPDAFSTNTALELKVDQWNSNTNLRMDGFEDVDCFKFTVPNSANSKTSITLYNYRMDTGIICRVLDGNGTEIGSVWRTYSGGYNNVELSLHKGYTYYACVSESSESALGYYGIYIDTKSLSTLPSVPSEPNGNSTAPAAPSISAANLLSSGKIKLSWNAVSSASYYYVYRQVAGSSSGYSYIGYTYSTTYTDTSAYAGYRYNYSVKAVNSYGQSSFSNVVQKMCKLPRPVVKISRLLDSGKIKLTWDAVSGAVSYKIYRSTTEDGTYTLIKTTTKTSFINKSVKVGQKYYYRVRAVAQNTDANSAKSLKKAAVCRLPRPVVSISLSSNKPYLSWGKISGASYYKVYRSTSKDGTYSYIAYTYDGHYRDDTAKKNTTYYYKVVAVYSGNSDANSARSKAVSIKSK